MASTTSKLTMRLLIDTKTEKVIFAVASKPVVDFLFYILCLPIGSVVKLLGNNSMAGSIENVYQSAQDLKEVYMYCEQSKFFLLNPIASISSNEFSNLLSTKNEDHMPPWSSSFGLSDFVHVHKLNIKEDKDYDKEKNGDNEEDDSEVDDYYTEGVEKSDDYYCYYHDEQAKDSEDGNDGVYYDEEEGYGYEDGENGDEYNYEEQTYYKEYGDDGVYFDKEEGYGYGENPNEYDSERQSNDNEDGDDDVYYDEEEGYGYQDAENGDEYDYEEHANYNEDDDNDAYYDVEEGYGYEDGENGDEYDYEEHANYNEDGENGDEYDYEEHANYNEDGDDGVYFDEEEGYDFEDGEDISTNNGFVKEKVTFMVMDDLVIQPFTFTSMIEVVNKFNIKEIREMIVELRMNEGIKLLKASLESKRVLTSVFVNKEY